MLLGLKFKIALIILKFVFFYIKKVKQTYFTACYRKLYILSNEQFPQNDLGKNSNLAIYLTSIFANNFEDNSIEIDKAEFEKLKSLAEADEWIKKTLSDLYKIISFSFIIDMDAKEQYFMKAKTINPNIQPITNFKEIIKLVENIKKDSKNFIKKGKELSEKKYSHEIEKRLQPIEVTTQDILFLITLFSTFFFISGIIYSKIYFYLLDVKISDFFSISDYLASSIDIIIITFFSIAIGFIFYFLGVKNRLKTSIYEEQFNTESTSRKKEFYSLVIVNAMCIFLFLASYYNHNTLHYNLLYPPILFLFFKFFWSMPIWQYFKNPEKIGLILMSFSTFIISLILTVLTYNDEILKKEVKDENYKIILKNANIDTGNLIFITSNSSNLFMLDAITKKVKIIPFYNVESIETVVTK